MKQQSKADIIGLVEQGINSGRTGTKIKIDGRSTPATVASRLSPSDLESLAKFSGYEGVALNNYTNRASILWGTIYYKLAEQINIVGSYNSPFTKFYQDTPLGAYVEEIAARMKEPLNRDTLPNTALFTDYFTQYDTIQHEIKKHLVFSTTRSDADVARIVTTWDSFTNFINAELENLEKSIQAYIQSYSKGAFKFAYEAGQLETVAIPNITNETDAQDVLITINNLVNVMSLEPNDKYIPYNRNTDSTTRGKVKDVASLDNMMVILRADLFDSAVFRTAVTHYFAGRFESPNELFSKNLILVDSFAPDPTATNPITLADYSITPGYSAVPASKLKELKGIVCERNALIFRKKELGSLDWSNPSTLKTTVFKHIDLYAGISDRRKICALV